MRFLTLTSIAVLAFASVSASSVDSFKDVGHTGEKSSPLLKRADQRNGDDSPTPAAGGGNGINKAKIDATGQESGYLSKRHKKSKDDPKGGKQQGDGAASDATGATGQGLGSLAKRAEQVNGNIPPGNGQGTGTSATVAANVKPGNPSEYGA